MPDRLDADVEPEVVASEDRSSELYVMNSELAGSAPVTNSELDTASGVDVVSGPDMESSLDVACKLNEAYELDVAFELDVASEICASLAMLKKCSELAPNCSLDVVARTKTVDDTEATSELDLADVSILRWEPGMLAEFENMSELEKMSKAVELSKADELSRDDEASSSEELSTLERVHKLDELSEIDRLSKIVELAEADGPVVEELSEFDRLPRTDELSEVNRSLKLVKLPEFDSTSETGAEIDSELMRKPPDVEYCPDMDMVGFFEPVSEFN